MTAPAAITFELDGLQRCNVGTIEEGLSDYASEAAVTHLLEVSNHPLSARDLFPALARIEGATPGTPDHYAGPEEDLQDLEDALSALNSHEDGSCGCWEEEEYLFRTDLTDALSSAQTPERPYWLLIESRGRTQFYYCLGSDFDIEDVVSKLGLDLTAAMLTWDPDSSTLTGSINHSRDVELFPLNDARQQIMLALGEHPCDGGDLGEIAWRVHTLPDERLAAATALADALAKLEDEDIFTTADCLNAAALNTEWTPAHATTIAAVVDADRTWGATLLPAVRAALAVSA